MARNEYHGHDMTLSMQTSAGTSIPVGVIHDVDIIESVEIDEQESADSIKRENVKQRSYRVNVSATVGSIDVAMIHQWQGGSGASSTGMVDTGDPAQFQITGAVTPQGGSTDLQAVVEGVTFPEMPVFSASEDAWIGFDLQGTGDDITTTGPS